MSVLRSPARGDMFVEIAVETPANLTRKQRELLEQFKAESGGNAKTSPEAEGFFARVKEFFDGGRE
jgi:molecular chaperone DnaJ